MPGIRYLVPYEIRVIAHDAISGRRSGHRQYWRTTPDGAIAAYGDTVPGGSSTTTMLANFKTLYEAKILPLLSVNYVMEGYEMRAMLGKHWGTPTVGISAMASTLTATRIVTGTPHGLVTGDAAYVQGVTTPPGVNGWYSGITKINNNEIEIPILIAGAWVYTGAGTVQKIYGNMDWIYADLENLTSTTAGSVTGEAVALFADASIQRFNPGIGKSWRSRFSLAPIGESDVEDGSFSSAALALWATALNSSNFNTNIVNGGSGSAAAMYAAVVSKLKAFQTLSPFAESDSWCKDVTSYRVHHYMGSQTKRKPKRLA